MPSLFRQCELHHLDPRALAMAPPTGRVSHSGNNRVKFCSTILHKENIGWWLRDIAAIIEHQRVGWPLVGLMLETVADHVGPAALACTGSVSAGGRFQRDCQPDAQAFPPGRNGTARASGR